MIEGRPEGLGEALRGRGDTTLQVSQWLDDMERAPQLVSALNLREIPGNPHGVDIRRTGAVLALRTASNGDWHPNRTFGLEPDHVEIIGEFLRWYHEAGVRMCVNLLPHYASERFTDHLVRLGFAHVYDHNMYAASLEDIAPFDPPDLDVQRFDRSTRVEWAKQSVLVHDFTATTRAAAIELRTAKNTSEHWTMYLIQRGGRPIAWARSFMSGGVVSLLGTMVHPDERRSGLHAALLSVRFADAVRCGCDVAIVQAEPDTAGHRNIMRAGFKLVYTKRLWIDQSPPSLLP